jgi:hypothetical protein
MPNLWQVISNSGELLILERSEEHLEISKPTDALGQGIFVKVVAGSTLSEIGVDLITRHKKAPQNEQESGQASIQHRPSGTPGTPSSPKT